MAQAMEKETSCCSCRLRGPLSASAAASVLAEAAPPVGARSPALRSRNSRRWRQCLSVSPSQRSASTQEAARGFWLRYSETSCAMLCLPVAEAASRHHTGEEAGARGERLCPCGLHRRPSRRRPSGGPRPKQQRPKQLNRPLPPAAGSFPFITSQPPSARAFFRHGSPRTLCGARAAATLRPRQAAGRILRGRGQEEREAVPAPPAP